MFPRYTNICNANNEGKCTICLKENLTSADVTISPLRFSGVFLINFEHV